MRIASASANERDLTGDGRGSSRDYARIAETCGRRSARDLPPSSHVPTEPVLLTSSYSLSKMLPSAVAGFSA